MKVAILGLGYRTRIIMKALQEIEGLEVVGFLVRTLDSIEAAKKEYGIKAFLSKEYILDLKPDFIINTVSKSVNTEFSLFFLEHNIPVLQETPAALNIEDINKLKKYKGLYQVAEQYQYYTYFKNVRKLINAGFIGEVREIVFSYAHDYHAISAIRSLIGDFNNLKMTGKTFKTKIAHTKTRYESFEDGLELEYKTKNILMEWDDIKIIFDFNSEEYRSTIRNPYLIIKGSRGEIMNDKIVFLDKHNICQNMGIGGFGSYNDHEPIKEVLTHMIEFVKTKKEFYPIEYALDDAYISIQMNSFTENLEEKVISHE